jgi:hypothetical protein
MNDSHSLSLYYPYLHDHATETRLSRLWLLQHRWLALAYRVVGLGMMATAGTGVVAVGWKVARWVLAWC